MFKNYLKSAWRNIQRNKGYSLINVIGLAFGIASCIVVSLFISHELSIDAYHTKGDRIVKLCAHVQIGGTEFKHSSSNGVASGYLKEHYPEVIDSVRFRWKGHVGGIRKDKSYSIRRIFYADQSVFNIFTWPLIQGDEKTALKDPYTIVINEKTAKSIFQNENPVGKTLTFNNRETYTITGVMKDIPKNSNRRFNALCSFKTLYANGPTQMLTTWTSFNFDTYLLLEQGVSYKPFEKKISLLLHEQDGESLKAKSATEILFLKPLRDMYLRPINNPVGPMAYIYIFSAIAIVILVIACINFMNLATARSSKRALEVGMRKTLGAGKKKLISQYLSESMLLSFISLVIAILIVLLLLPGISSLIERELELNLSQLPWLFPGLILLTILVGIGAGSYPAFYLSSLQPTSVLKGKLKSSTMNRRLRRGLVIFQFSISISLIIFTLFMMKQLNHMQDIDPGFNKNNVVVLNIDDGKSLASRLLLKEKFKNSPGVISVATSSSLPSWGCPSNDKLPQGYTRADTQLMDEINVDENFIPTLGMTIIAGRNFSKEFPSDHRNSIIINETAAKRFGWKNPVGKTITAYDPYKIGQENPYKTMNVIGVVKDYYQRSMTRQIDPLYIGNDPNVPTRYNFLRYMTIRVKPGQIKKTLTHLKTQWESIITHRDFDPSFMDEEFDAQFQDIINSRKLLSNFTILAILIACLGLLGLASFTAEKRTKEIGIRKVMGSSILRIVSLLSKELLLLVTIANIIAWPLAFLLANKWLGGFPYRIGITLMPFLFASILVLLIGFFTISFHAIKAARANPIDSLRYE